MSESTSFIDREFGRLAEAAIERLKGATFFGRAIDANQVSHLLAVIEYQSGEIDRLRSKVLNTGMP